MKKLLILLTVSIMASLLSVSALAKTVYVSDGGDGSGSSASAPLGSLSDAYTALGDGGGEIVIVGTVTVPLNRQSYTTTDKVFVEPAHSKKITVRGNDEKATLLFASPYEYHMEGETEFCDLIISSGAYTKGIAIAARGYHLTMGDGIRMHSTGTVNGEVGTKVYLYAGCQNGVPRTGYESRNNYMTVKSGSYWVVGGFNRNKTVTSTGRATLELGGGDLHIASLITGSTAPAYFKAPAGADIFVLGDFSMSNQISLGNQNTDAEYFSTNLILMNGYWKYTGSVIDFNKRTRVTELDIYVNTESPSALRTYSEIFAGYGDREGTLADYCTNELGGHSYKNSVCTACGISKAVAECTVHSFRSVTEGTLVTNVCKNCGFAAKLTAKEPTESGVYTYKIGNLRVQILSDDTVRIEESRNGGFVDSNTLVVNNRDGFSGTLVAKDCDEETVILATKRFTVNIPKENATAASVKIFDSSARQIYSFFENDKHSFYASLPSPSSTPDTFVIIDNGIIPPGEGLTYTGSTDSTSGWTKSDNSDTYVLIPLCDSARLRSAFVSLTGRTYMSNIKALGSWYSKWTSYSGDEKLAMIAEYRKKSIPLDMIVIDTEWKNTSANGNDGDGTGYVTNDTLYPDMPAFLEAAEKAGTLVLFNDHTHKTDLKITDPTELKWQSEGIRSLMKKGLDGWWYDRNWTYSIKSPYSDVLFSTLGQVLYNDTMEKYHSDTKEGDYKQRTLMLSNVDWIKHGHITGDPSLIGHRYGIQWTGDIYGDPLQLRREIENMVLGGVNGASPYMSSDLGGFWHNDTVTENHFIRWMQYGAFSPVTRVHSTLSAKNEHLPWSYGENAEAIVKSYLDMRYHLMPYYYMLARENYDTGMPLMRRLDFYYPEYEEASDNSQYLIGRDLLVAPFWSTEGDGQFAVPESWLKTKDGKSGLYAEYFNTEKGMAKTEYFTGTPVHTETVPTLDFYWYTGSPAEAVAKDYFAARFTGTITPDYDCYIGTLADDGARIYIDGKRWSDGYASSQVRPYLNNNSVLKAGETHEITVEYYELAGKAILYLVCEPVVGKNMSSRSVFIPSGVWINAFSGEKITGPKTVTVTGNIDEMPIFIRYGAALPVGEVTSPLTGADWEKLSVNIYGLDSTSFTLYEDDGETEGYMDGVYRKTDISVTPLTSDSWQIDVEGGDGSFKTDYSSRRITLRIHSDIPIASAIVDGKLASVTKLSKEAGALPFASSGASAISDVYEISADVSVLSGASITVFAAEIEDIDKDGTLSLRDALLALEYLLNDKHEKLPDVNKDGKSSLADIVAILEKMCE